MTNSKILAFSGSIRSASFNRKLITLAVNTAQKIGANVTLIDLKDFPMPIYNGDDEASTGLPDNAKKLKDIFRAHQGLMIASPEYNSSISPLLKNTIDWVSRKSSPSEGELECFKGKIASLMSASPGALGGLRGLVHLRSILGNIGVIVLTEQVSVSQAQEAFDSEGQLKDAKKQKQLENLVTRLSSISAKLQG